MVLFVILGCMIASLAPQASVSTTFSSLEFSLEIECRYEKNSHDI